MGVVAKLVEARAAAVTLPDELARDVASAMAYVIAGTIAGVTNSTAHAEALLSLPARADLSAYRDAAFAALVNEKATEPQPQ